MALDHVYLLDYEASFIGMHAQDFATLPFVFSGNDLDKIILADMPRTGNSLLHG